MLDGSYTNIFNSEWKLSIIDNAFAGDIRACEKNAGWTGEEFDTAHNYHSSDKSPIVFYNEYISILDCWANNHRAPDGRGWIFGFLDRKIDGMSSKIGFKRDDCFKRKGFYACKDKQTACVTSCNATYQDSFSKRADCVDVCLHEKFNSCFTAAHIACEEEFKELVFNYAQSLEKDQREEESPEPECDPFEYFVSGRCQHIFELCGHDSLFQYNPSNGVCSCPDPYLPSNGKCVHEDDLYPPEPPVVDTPPLPPANEPPPPPEPPVDEPPADDQDFPPDDPRNQFCQPPEDAEYSYNEYGIPIANAQIFSNYSVVTHTEGEVLVMTKNAPRWAPVYKGQRISIGDKIKTGRNGTAEVKFANSAVFRMRPLSQLEIPDHKDGCSCHINHKVGYLDMKFGKVWSKVKPVEDECDWWVKTPTAIAGGSDRYDPDLARGYVNYDSGEGEGEKRTFKDLWYDIINNLSSDNTPSNSIEHYREPQSFRESCIGEVAFNVINIKKALAEGGGEIILHSAYDEETQISKFYVEKGEVKISDPKEYVSVIVSEGETMSVSPDTVPHDMDVQPASQVSGQWWEEWNDDSGLSILIPIVLYIGGIVFVIRKVLKSKRGVFSKIGMFIFGFVLMNFIVSILMLFV